MGKFDDLISTVGVGDDGVTVAYPETFLSDIGGAYAEDMAIPAAKIEVQAQEIAVLQQENLLLKAHNYELLTQVPSDDGTPVEGDENSDSDDEDTSDITTDDLFGESDDKDKD